MKQKITPFTGQCIDHLSRLNLLTFGDAVLNLCYTGAQMFLQLEFEQMGGILTQLT